MSFGNDGYMDRLEAEIARLRAENERLRKALDDIAELAWEGFIDGADFQDVMERHGLFVEIPASEQIREEYECDTMFVLAWSPLARTQEADDGE